MEKLKGKTLLIGKEPGQGRLLVSVDVNGQFKTAAIGAPGSVPNTVSRCKPAEGTAHCKLVVDDAGYMTLTNLKSQNVTFVNGQEIVSKRLTPSCAVALGVNRFDINLGGVLKAAEKLVGDGTGGGGGGGDSSQSEYSIKHLELIWNEYNTKKKQIRIRQKNLNLITSIPMAITMLGGSLIGVAPDIAPYAKLFTGIAFLIFLITLYLRFTDKSIKEEEELNEKFQDNYVCPNPKCHHFMGNQPYKILRQNKQCPYCRCKLTDK